MNIPWLDAATPFPSTDQAMGLDTSTPGLLAAGADLSPSRLSQAYASGIFPWFSQGQPVLWWSPDPRMVLQVDRFKLSDSLRKSIKSGLWSGQLEIRIDTALQRVLKACASAPRSGQAGTWILPEMQEAYLDWHAMGAVHSVETWWEGDLVGGLYGVGLGRMFFGESMFSRRTDASKMALAALVAMARHHNITWIDCQQNTSHLASLGAEPVSRQAFDDHLARTVTQPGVDDWSYHPSWWSLLDGRLGRVPVISPSS